MYETPWEYLEREWIAFAVYLTSYRAPWWPATLSLLESWWILVGFIGVLVSSYDIWRAQREHQYPWTRRERAERGIATTGLIKSIALGSASILNLTAGIVMAHVPPSNASQEWVSAGTVVVLCLILVEILIVFVTAVRDMERVFVRQFVWTSRERTSHEQHSRDAAPCAHYTKAPPLQVPPPPPDQ
jgi:hypothetical protein